MPALDKYALPLLVGLIFGSALHAQNSTTAGEFTAEPPTLVSLGFEWRITGDDNRNATVAVQYRKAGESQWREALPLLRIGDEKVWRAREFLEYWTPRMFAGSILDLEPDTPYEARFVLSDPDGIGGPASAATKTVTVRTRPEPKQTPRSTQAW